MKKLVAEKVKVSGDIPSPRFGHTFTAVSSNKAVLFGGAIAQSGRFVITNETYIYDFITSKWQKLNFQQEFVPTQRAAHAAVAVADMQMIVYGGAASNNQGLLKDDLYLLDLRKEPVWKIIEVSNKNNTPGQRYGHTLLFNKPYLVIFGGNSGSKAENDVWLLNILKGPFSWQKYEFQNRIAPCPRVYHSAAICEEGSAAGMMVVFGGRKETKKEHGGSQRECQVAALNDIWGLRRHRDGSWDWATPPRSETYTPLCRYQHLVCFLGGMLVIMGGRSNNAEEAVSLIQVYDTEKSEWVKAPSISRYRHALALHNKQNLYIHGGFEPELASSPLQSMIRIDLSPLTQPSRPAVNGWVEGNNKGNRNVLGSNDNINNIIRQQQNQAQKAPPRRDFRNSNAENQNQRSSRIKSGTSMMNKTAKQRDLTPSRIINNTKNIRLSNQVVVATGENTALMQVQRVPVNSLLEESKKLTEAMEDSPVENLSAIELAETVIQTLMGPNRQKSVASSTIFPFKKEKVVRLCQQAAKLVLKDTTLIEVRTPAKIFGSIYGRYFDLMRLFQNFGFPDDRQLESNQYVFLGNYVDKGFNSLETVCLLMALKIRHPEHMTLLRGRHEDSTINRICGLGEECAIRMGENINDINSVFNQINNFFDRLPLAAAVEDKFLCLHSGIGSIESLIDIRDVRRPVKVRESRLVMNLLWSGNKPEPRLKYEAKACSDQQVEQFLDDNCLQMLINTRDGLRQGVDDAGHTLSVFSVTNYGNSQNKAGVLKINKDLSLAPYLLNSSPSKKGQWVLQVATNASIPFSALQNEVRSQMLQL